MDQWLVRTSQNLIAGPYTREQILELIHNHELGAQDEICQANNYWIYLHEREEVTKALGAEISFAATGEDEMTETDTEKLERLKKEQPVTVTPMPAPAAAAQAAPSAASTDPNAPRKAPLRLPRPQTLYSAEKPTVVRSFAWTLLAGAALILWAIVRLARH